MCLVFYCEYDSWFFCLSPLFPSLIFLSFAFLCNPNPVQNFYWEIRSDPNPVDLSKYFIQSGIYPKKTLIKHFTAVINAVWISISDPFDFFRNPVRTGSGSELQNPIGSRSGNRIMFNTGIYEPHVSSNIPPCWFLNLR